MAHCLTVLTRTETTHLCLCVCVFVCIQCVCVWTCPNFNKKYVCNLCLQVFIGLLNVLTCSCLGINIFRRDGGPESVASWDGNSSRHPCVPNGSGRSSLSLSFSKENIDVVAWTVWCGVWFFKKVAVHRCWWQTFMVDSIWFNKV